ncbi:hypothetical protein ANCCAN_29562 [Ancylostoma caninum]|uniref:Uncharacterized protein n=1 Tax=Ancylostoma caninum TaxID=29170 RepID=A0A368EY83_ANCCA|nr:hypothetical protein ANCCAN_29562 [Ancylostoma caninum]
MIRRTSMSEPPSFTSSEISSRVLASLSLRSSYFSTKTGL